MKTKARVASILIAALFTLTGCGNSGSPVTAGQVQDMVSQNADIKLTVLNANILERDELTYAPLDQLNTFPDLRRDMDTALNIIKFGQGSKNGVLYVDLGGDWASNNTLRRAFANKEFVHSYWEDVKVKKSICTASMNQFSDVSDGDVALLAAYNAYYNILPACTDGTSGLMGSITRREAMAAIYRADTPVLDLQPTEFDNIFGYDEYNDYAYNLKNESYLQVDNGGLNPYTYYSPITRAEVVYMIVQRYFKEEYDAMTSVPNGGFSDVTNAGDIGKDLGIEGGHAWQTYVLEKCLEKPNDGLSEDLYKALVIARQHGMIVSKTRWNEPCKVAELIYLLTSAYASEYSDSTYPVNAKNGNNTGENTLEQE